MCRKLKIFLNEIKEYLDKEIAHAHAQEILTLYR